MSTSPVAFPSRYRLTWAPVRRAVGGALVAAVVFLAAAGGPVTAAVLMGLLAVAGLIWLAAAHPTVAVIGFIVWVPLQAATLAFLYNRGAPALLVKDLGYLKEFWVMALIVAPFRQRGVNARRVDSLDWVVLALIAVTTAELVLPFVAPGTLGGQSFAVRLSAWRLDSMFLIAFLCVRRLDWPPDTVRRLRIAVFFVGLVLAGFAIWEATDTAGFNNFQTRTLDLPRYFANILHNVPASHASLTSTGSVGNSTYTRVGSLFTDPETLGFFILVPLAVALERLAARRQVALAAIVAGLATTTVLLTITRAAVLAAGVIVLLAVCVQISRVSTERLRIVLVAIVAVALLLPMAGGSVFVARMQGVFSPQHDDNTQVHISRTKVAASEALAHPLGRGLGANNAVGNRHDTDTLIVSQNTYLETANELGVPAMVIYVTALMMLLARLRRRSKGFGEAAGLAGGIWIAGWGLALGGLDLEVWYQLAVTLAFWVLAGVALSMEGNTEEEAPPDSAV